MLIFGSVYSPENYSNSGSSLDLRNEMVGVEDKCPKYSVIYSREGVLTIAKTPTYYSWLKSG